MEITVAYNSSEVDKMVTRYRDIRASWELTLHFVLNIALILPLVILTLIEEMEEA